LGTYEQKAMGEIRLIEGQFDFYSECNIRFCWVGFNQLRFFATEP